VAFALAPQLPAHVDAPAIVRPASREVSFGRISGKVGAGTYRIVVRVDGHDEADERVHGTTFDLRVDLPPRDATIEVEAEDALGNTASSRVTDVLGLPAAAEEVATGSHEDAALARTVSRLVDDFPGTSAVYVESLATGAGAAWNATARFPAASTVKLAIAVELLRILTDRPEEGTKLDVLLRDMLAASDNEAANALLEWIGSTDTGGADLVNRTLESLELGDTHLYGAFLTASGGAPIPLTTESEPSFAGKYTSAWDLAQLFRFVHLAATGKGPLLDLQGSFEPSDARAILWLLAHAEDNGKLDRFLGQNDVVAHKAGWISDARHDAGLVYTPDGAFVAAVMTYTGGNAGDSSDQLAGEVARAAKERLGEAEAVATPSASSS
jgi:beta-lactamase class A